MTFCCCHSSAPPVDTSHNWKVWVGVHTSTWSDPTWSPYMWYLRGKRHLYRDTYWYQKPCIPDCITLSMSFYFSTVQLVPYSYPRQNSSHEGNYPWENYSFHIQTILKNTILWNNFPYMTTTYDICTKALSKEVTVLMWLLFYTSNCRISVCRGGGGTPMSNGLYEITCKE